MTKFNATEFVRTHTHEEVDAEVDRLNRKAERFGRIAVVFLFIAAASAFIAVVLQVVR